MSFTTAPKFTNAGKQLQLAALGGAPLVFTAIKIGDGRLTSQAPETLTDLVHPLLRINVEDIKVSRGFASVRGGFSNSDLTEGFYWREVGLCARGADNADVLYCYANAFDLAEYIAPAGSEIIEKIVSISAVVGDAEKVEAVIDSSQVYATKKDLAGKADRDLGNVDAEVFAQLVAAAESNIDCGLFDELAAVAAHDGTPDAHAAMRVDGNAAAPVGTAETLEEHMIDPAAHQNIVLDGNQ